MILAIDTSTAACTAALFDEAGACIARADELIGRGHAERLVPMIAEMLDGRTASQILVGVGPGSFTGIRVGIAAAHGLAIGWGVKLRGYSSLALIAAGAPPGEYAVALNGGHGQLFVQTYGDDPLRPLHELRSLMPDEAAAAVTAERVIGSGAEALVSARGWGRSFDALPRAADARLLPEPLRTLPPRPIYGREPDAKPMQ